ncbi:MAG: ATP-binding cassette domain-containing protein [Chloroflexota bacterium]|nr:ATP-binding cassette domain-containing protein [Chloroflexota bacterium]MDE2686532.1 ATP-binding cassette domain-containing protein [Chloroflexota bacterium]
MTTAEQNTKTSATNGADVSIEVSGVSKFFGELAAVNDLTFSVRKGEVVGFLGPNGSGKTTTMRMLTSFYTPDVGGINIDGLDTKDHDIATRERIGYLPENNPVYADLLVSEYLDFVADLRGLTKQGRRENIAQTVEETGLQDVYMRPIGQLSKGYKQRVGLAQAIVHRPSILILDEPTEGLDPNQRLTIRDLIRSLGQERTVMLSTHVMQEVENTCERILLISRGKLVADSTVKELLQRAQGIRTVHIEVEGNDVERPLTALDGVADIERHESMDGRKRYTITADGNSTDLRPDIFRLAKQRDWVLWELREDRARMEDVFVSLTAAGQQAQSSEDNE